VFACLHRLDRRIQIRTAPELSERSRLTAAMETGPRRDPLAGWRTPALQDDRLRQPFKGCNGETAVRYDQPWLDHAEERLGRSMQPLALIDQDEREDYFGVFGAVWNLVPAKPTREVLGQTRQHLHRDRGFAFMHEDSAFTQLDQIMRQPASIHPGSSSVLILMAHLDATVQYGPGKLCNSRATSSAKRGKRMRIQLMTNGYPRIGRFTGKGNWCAG
jgi:hypothetical protein